MIDTILYALKVISAAVIISIGLMFALFWPILILDGLFGLHDIGGNIEVLWIITIVVIMFAIESF